MFNLQKRRKEPDDLLETLNKREVAIAQREHIIVMKELKLEQAEAKLEQDRELLDRDKGNWVSINEYRESRRKASEEEAYERGKSEGRIEVYKKIGEDAGKATLIDDLKKMVNKSIDALAAQKKA